MPLINRDDTASETERRQATGLSSLPPILPHYLKSQRQWGEPWRFENAMRLRGSAPPRRGAASFVLHQCMAVASDFTAGHANKPVRLVTSNLGVATRSPHAMRWADGPDADRRRKPDAVEVALAHEDVARAIAEIEDAVEALREPPERFVDTDEGKRATRSWLWLGVAGMWTSIGVAAAAMLGGLALLMR